MYKYRERTKRWYRMIHQDPTSPIAGNGSKCGVAGSSTCAVRSKLNAIGCLCETRARLRPTYEGHIHNDRRLVAHRIHMARQRRMSTASTQSEVEPRREQELGSMYDYLAKIILLGPSGCGKSCLLHRFVKGEWRILSSQTIGVEFASKIVRVGTGARRKRIKLQVGCIRAALLLWTNILFSAMGHRGHGAIPIGFALVLPRRSGRPAHLRYCQSQLLWSPTYLSQRRPSPGIPEPNPVVGRQQGRHRR